MIRHVVVISWRPEATPEQRQRVSAELAGLPPLMRGIRAYSYGPDAGLAEGNGDFAIVADFEDAGAYLAYRDHPAHRDVIKRVIDPILARRTAVQIEIGEP